MYGYRNLVNIIIAVILVVKYTSADPDLPALQRRKRIVGGVEAAKPLEDDPVVFISKNGRDARIYGGRDERKGFYVFRGIRFGEPPVGRHRFQRPRRVQPEGNVNATEWRSPCPQPDRKKVSSFIGSEDCLFLNIFTPALPDGGDGYPVLVWIHGGGFRSGSASQYEMKNLIKMKMIVVSIQYRLGSLGFLSTGGKDLPGNNGMFDMVLAVNWVRDYIEFFGGDPKKIIAFGHGTGASSAMMLSLSKLTQNLFSGLIALSGSALSHFAIDKDPMSSARSVALTNDCPIEDVSEMIRCLQELPVENLIGADSILENIRTSVEGLVAGFGMLGPGPVVEGLDDQRSLPNFLTNRPERFLELGDFPKIPLLSGVMKDETAEAVFSHYRKEVRGKVDTVPNLLNENLIKTLQGTIPHLGSGNSSRHFVPEAFSKYLNIFDGTARGDVGADNILKKVAQVTGDALFNAPAFITTQLWSKNGKTFFYSFDYDAGKNFGRDFLGGLPSSVDPDKIIPEVPSHGDELGYIFGRNTIFGDRLTDADAGPVEPEAQNVIEAFTEIIAKFVHHGEISVSEKKLTDGMLSKIPTFVGSDTTKANPYVSVTTKLTPMNNFRYCEMGLWAGLVQRLQSTTCELFKSSVETIQRVQEEALDTAEEIGQGTADVGKKIVKGVFNPGELGRRAAANIEKVILNLVPGFEKTTASKTAKVEQENSVRPKMQNVGGLLPVQRFFG